MNWCLAVLLSAAALAQAPAAPSAPVSLCAERRQPRTELPPEPGPAWSVSRSSSKGWAVARVPRGGTLRGLAKTLGLEPARLDCWASADAPLLLAGGRELELSVVPLDAPLSHYPPQRLRVPNTVVTGWMGDFGEVGRAVESWDADRDYLRALGFKLELWEPAPGKDGEGRLRAMIESASAEKRLHGFFTTAHGSCEAVGQEERALMSRADFPLRYLLALVIVNACGADFAAELHGKGVPGSVFYGPDGIRRPVLETGHTTELLAPGAQGTRRVRSRKRPS